MAWVLPTIFVVGGGAFGYKSGFFQKWSGYENSNNNNSNNNNNPKTLPQQQQQQLAPQVIVYEPNNSNNSNSGRLFAISGSTALLILAGYYYYIHKSGTKQVITKVEETAEQTQDLVVKSDKNNEKRFNELDSRNEQRSQTLESEIRSETRAGFQMVSEQLYCLTQVCIQTLSSIATTGNQDNSDVVGEFGSNGQDNNLLSYCDRAQEMADTLISEETLLTKRSQNLQDIRAEIHARAPLHTQTSKQQQYVTAGGPDCYDTPMGPDDTNGNSNGNSNNNNIFDVDAHQTPYLTNISYKDNNIRNNNNTTNNGDVNNETKGNSNSSNDNKNGGILRMMIGENNASKLSNLFEIYKIEEEFEKNKYLLLSGACAALSLYASYNYVSNSNSNGYNGNNNNNRYNNSNNDNYNSLGNRQKNVI